MSSVPQSLAIEFERLRLEWVEATQFTSSMNDLVAHPAYQAIIRMGKRAVPLLLQELEARPNHWGPALSTITGANPVPSEHAGNLHPVLRRGCLALEGGGEATSGLIPLALVAWVW